MVGPLKDEIIDGVSKMLAPNAPKTAFGIFVVLDDLFALGARNTIFAAGEILYWPGLVKKEQVKLPDIPVGCLF